MRRANNKDPRRKHKKYHPDTHFVPPAVNKRIKELEQKINKNQELEELKINALQNYFELITNFTSHDIKNAIQNMDGVVSTISSDLFNSGDIQTLNDCLSNIRNTLSDFNQLVPSSEKRKFTISELNKAIEILNKATFNKNNIKYEVKLNDKGTEIRQSLHSIIQVLNNLILNSLKALKDIDKKRIQIKYDLTYKELKIYVCDNGCGVKEIHKDKIFDIYFSTTQGSGIGLAHAKFVINDSMKGSIELINPLDGFNTVFKLIIPIK